MIIHLTWKSTIGFVYDKKTFALKKKFKSPFNECWGLTHNGSRLIVSDGSSTLYFLDPATFSTISTLAVRENSQKIDNLNELEYVGGEIFANILFQDRIVRINPSTGEVTGWIDLNNLLPTFGRNKNTQPLNGIAFNAKNNSLFITAKNWPHLYEIIIVPDS